MKKNKRMAYALAVTLLVGGTFVGTKALFTDMEQVAGELKISTGDVDIEVVGDTNWVLDRNGNEYADGSTVGGETGINVPLNEIETEVNFANNIKPGDVLTKEITIKNAGTLIANVGLVRNEEVNFGVLEGFLTLEETLVEGQNVDSLIMHPEEEIKVQLRISANGGGLHNTDDVTTDGVTIKNYNKDTIEKTTVDLTNAWTLHATQQTGDYSVNLLK